MIDTPNAPDIAEDKIAYERKFIEDLAKWLKDDNGKAAALRRCAGDSIGEKNLGWFFSLLGARLIVRLDDGRFKDEDAYFLVATLFASDKDAIDGKNKFKGDFGATLRAQRNASGILPSEPSPLDRRFDILLDADFDLQTGGELAYRLRQVTKRVIALKDSTARIDWAQLLYDVKHWNSQDKWIQKKWARSYYAPSLNSQTHDLSESDTQE
jgi:CRISPR system Cascade subunit CasB